LDDHPLNKKGFTLIELLLAVGLSAMMVGVVMGTFVAIRKGVKESIRRNDVAGEGRMLLQKIRRDMEAATLGNPELTDRFIFKAGVTGEKRDTSVVSFVTAAAGDGRLLSKGVADLGRVTYRLVPSRKRPGYGVLMREVSPLFSKEIVVASRLSDRVAGFRIFYRGKNGGITQKWNSGDAREKDKLSLLIRVELVLRDIRGKKHSFRCFIHPVQDWME
jgi:prepilin-type N-terminal cleavage/methylation domain-containing protein